MRANIREGKPKCPYVTTWGNKLMWDINQIWVNSIHGKKLRYIGATI
jgi:hypothetical protein